MILRGEFKELFVDEKRLEEIRKCLNILYESVDVWMKSEWLFLKQQVEIENLKSWL